MHILKLILVFSSQTYQHLPSGNTVLNRVRSLALVSLPSGHSSLKYYTHLVYSLQSTVHSPQSTVHFLQSTVYSLQSTVYSLQSTVYSLQSTVYSLQSTVYSLQSTCLQSTCLQSTVYSLQFTDWFPCDPKITWFDFLQVMMRIQKLFLVLPINNRPGAT